MHAPATFDRVLVVGAGTMGTQIAAVFALAGYTVGVADIDRAALDRSEDEASRRIFRLVEKGVIPADQGEMAINRLAWSDNAASVATDADLVVEAATERLDLKRRIFAELDAVAPEHAVFTTNSSTIPSSMIAEASGRADRLCNLHFFNPALVMECVEVVPNPLTSQETLDVVDRVVTRIGKRAVRVQKEVPGFIANRLMMALQDEAVALLEQGVGTIGDIDTAARSALSHPMGPFELMDLVGLDVIEFMHTATFEITGDDRDRPARSLRARVASGDLGRKSGRGWLEYKK